MDYHHHPPSLSPSDDTEYLGAPLLQDDETNHNHHLGDLLLSSNLNHNHNSNSTSYPPESYSTSTYSYNNNMFSYGSSTMAAGAAQHPWVRRALQMRTAADALPELLSVVVTSGAKLSVLGFLGLYLMGLAVWIPLWLLSLVTTELGIYVLAIGIIYGIGRSIIRLIAFPGASPRVTSELEREFAKYSVKLLVQSCNSILDLSNALVSLQSQGNKNADASTNPVDFYELPSLWTRAKSYRDRVLAVYAQVLQYLLQPNEAVTATTTATTKYGNNPLSGDIGDLSGLTTQAQADGKRLWQLLTSVLHELDRLEQQAGSVLLVESSTSTSQPQLKLLSTGCIMVATNLVVVVSELRDYAESLKPTTSDNSNTADMEQAMLNGGDYGDNDDDEDLTVEAVRRRLEAQGAATGSSPLEAVQAGVASILTMLDPPPHTSIFGMDVQRGCVLSRYHGARQLWVPRPGGGMLDVLHIPAAAAVKSTTATTTNPRAVLYCNPNAGLIEVAAGMSLAGGNVGTEGVVNDNCWTDYYTNHGFDVYLFNYAGFGRSYGTATCGLLKRGGEEPYHPGWSGRLRRIAHGTFFSFQPTPDTLRADGLAVGTHLLSHVGVEQLVIHGESIGGLAASFTAAKLTESAFLRDKVSLLICDRTFCNLEAVAQRLVGGWSGYAIRMLAPFWNTDVAGSYLSANCPKIVANDCADAIIADSSSLKSGISFWKEVHRGAASTRGVGWIMDTPLEYRMADWENVNVRASRYVTPSFTRSQAPTWPSDKQMTLEECFHFAACTKRIGKLASIEKKRHMMNNYDAEQGVSTGADCTAPIFLAWKILGCCDGLCGSALGMAVRGGFDNTVVWLCNTLIFGGQTVVESMEHRLNLSLEDASSSIARLGGVLPEDFDCRPPGYEEQESETVIHPKPVPEVVTFLKQILEGNPDDELLKSVGHELGFVVGTLEYVAARLSAPVNVEYNWKNRHLRNDGSATMVGSFLNLHCGHNSPFSDTERRRLRGLLMQAMPSHQPLAK